MRKHLSILLLCMIVIFMFIQPIRAHLVGAFEDFLVGLQDEDSTKKLKDTIEKTEGQYKTLKKKTDEQRKVYEKEQENMLEILTFYDTVAFDTYASFILDSGEMVDMMANQKIMEKQLDKDLKELESFYNQYQQLNQAMESVEGYRELLKAIGENNKQKERLSKIFPNLEKTNKEQFASLLQAIWNQDIRKIDEHMIEDSKNLSNNIAKWMEEGSTNGINTLDYKAINKHSDLKYLIQKDHVYIIYDNGDGHVILISQLAKHPDIKNAYYLELEAGFLNGYAVSTKVLQELNGLYVIRYDSLIDKENKDWVIQQSSNSFIFQPTSTIMD